MGKCVHNLPVQTRSGIVMLAALVLQCFLQTRRAAGLLVVELLASGEADDELNAAAAPWLIIAMDCILVDYGSTRYTFFSILSLAGVLALRAVKMEAQAPLYSKIINELIKF